MAGVFYSNWNNNDSKTNARKNVYKYFQKKYFKHTQPGFLEESARLDAKKLKGLVPGEIYTFLYDPITPDLPWYDARPFIYVISEQIENGTGNHTVLGWNLNFLPEIERVKFFDIMYRVFEKVYTKTYDKFSNRVIDHYKLQVFLQDKDFIKKKWSKFVNIGFCYRKYILDNITTPVLIETEDYADYMFYNTKSTTVPIGTIFKEYYDYGRIYK
jgi:hypothetical protein